MEEAAVSVMSECEVPAGVAVGEKCDVQIGRSRYPGHISAVGKCSSDNQWA